NRWSLFIQQCKAILNNKKVLITITAASLIISLNWLVFIWAVQNGYVVQSSLGYYINPLISVLFAILFLREKLSTLQLFSFILACGRCDLFNDRLRGISLCIFNACDHICKLWIIKKDSKCRCHCRPFDSNAYSHTDCLNLFIIFVWTRNR